MSEQQLEWWCKVRGPLMIYDESCKKWWPKDTTTKPRASTSNPAVPPSTPAPSAPAPEVTRTTVDSGGGGPSPSATSMFTSGSTREAPTQNTSTPTSGGSSGESNTSTTPTASNSTPTSTGGSTQDGSSGSGSSGDQSNSGQSTSGNPNNGGGSSGGGSTGNTKSVPPNSSSRLTTSTDSNGNAIPASESLPAGATATAGDPFMGGAARPSTTGQTSSVGASQSGPNTGAIVGGVLGALALIVIFIVAVLVVRRRRRNQRVAPSAAFMQRYGNAITIHSPSPTPTRGYEDEDPAPSNYHSSQYPSQYPFSGVPDHSPRAS